VTFTPPGVEHGNTSTGLGHRTFIVGEQALGEASATAPVAPTMSAVRPKRSAGL